MRDEGIPITGFTWYSLTDQIDWQHALRVERNDVHPVGLYDLDRRVRPVGARYRELISAWRDVLHRAGATPDGRPVALRA
jgi:beta-glucosidase